MEVNPFLYRGKSEERPNNHDLVSRQISVMPSLIPRMGGPGELKNLRPEVVKYKA